jgi:apolipoprotein N-acyltransferase
LRTHGAASVATAPEPVPTALGRRRALAGLGVLASGAGLALAWPEPGIGFVAWIALAPLLLVTPGTPARVALVYGWAFGIGFFGVLLVWISLIGWVGWALLVALQAAFVAAFALAWSFVGPRLGGLGRVFVPPALWVALEFLRAVVPLGGFTWGQLAQSQHDGRLLRLAALGGGWLVAGAVVLVNAAVAEAVRKLLAGRRRGALAAATVAAAALVVPELVSRPEAGGEHVRVAIAQGNVPQGFAGPLLDKELTILRNHERVTRALAGRGVDLVVWPESSVGVDLERVTEARAAVAGAARAVDAPMIVGGNLDVGSDRYRVMAFHVSARGEVVDRYQKTHLVPFGEYVPARRWLEWIPMLDQVPRDAIAGDEPVTFDVAGGRVAPVISYEGDFGPLVRGRIAAGGRLLVVATNTSTWGRSWASRQHLAFSQVRAVENGVWVVHAALSGISALVRPDGELAATTPLWTTTDLVGDVRFSTGTTLYARTGEWFPLLCAVVCALALGRAAVRARARRP